jgi:NADH dehydrogenase
MILVTGGTGAIGSPLVRGLVERGNKIRILTLPNDKFVHRVNDLVDKGSVDVIYGDVSDINSLKGKFDGVKTIYHLAAVLLSHDPTIFERVNVHGTRNMIQMGIECGAEHFIFVSSASVFYPIPTPYSLSKRECERLVKEQTTMKWTIVRPTLAYSTIGGDEFMMFLNYLKRYKRIVPFIGRGKALKAPVYTQDLMRGFLAIPNNPKAYNKEYNFSGGEKITIRDLAKLVLEHQGRTPWFLPLPVWFCQLLSKAMGWCMAKPPLNWATIAGIIFPADLDNFQACKDLGYNPIGVRTGLQQCFPLGPDGKPLPT